MKYMHVSLLFAHMMLDSPFCFLILLLHGVIMVEIILRVIIVSLIVSLPSNYHKGKEDRYYEGCKSSSHHG